MSTVYISLAMERLADALAERLRSGGRDPFVPAEIVTPHPMVRRWLEMRLSDESRLGIAMNLRFDFLEQGLWRALTEMAGAGAGEPPCLLGARDASLLVLRALLEGSAVAGLRPFYEYAGGDATDEGYSRRLWQLAGELSERFRDYEYHRPEMVARWLGSGRPLSDPVEAAERELYRRAFGPGGALEATGTGSDGQRITTLDRYAREVLSAQTAASPGPPLHVFAVATMSESHIAILRALGTRREVLIYHASPLGAEGFDRPIESLPPLEDEAGRVLRQWYRLALVSGERLRQGLLEGPDAFALVALDPPPEPLIAANDLGRLHGTIAGREPEHLTGDGTVRVLAAPSVYREVEAVRDDIVASLLDDAELLQNDVGILVADPDEYMPVLRAVFGRDPALLRTNMSGYGAAVSSLYAAGLRSLLELVSGRFSRTDAFGLLANPCFLARHGLSREEADTWREWIARLGVYHSWDAADRHARGYGGSDAFTWRQGLRRLRLGGIMRPRDEMAAPEDGDPYARTVPFRDLASDDRESVSRFDEIVEGLLTGVLGWQRLRLAPEQWSERLLDLIDAHLAIPEDRPAEEGVAREVRAILDSLRLLGSEGLALGFSLVQQILTDGLTELGARRGTPLDGVSIVALRPPLRVTPFRLLYVMGLNESAFPGSSHGSALDLLRSQPAAHEADLGPVDQNRHLGLEALLQARGKLRLSYLARDLQKDEERFPSPMLSQLMRLVGCRSEEPGILRRVPLTGSDPRYLRTEGDPPQPLEGFSRVEQALGWRRAGETADDGEVARVLAGLRPWQAGAQATRAEAGPVTRVTVRRLAGFLAEPLTEGLRLHLRVREDLALEVETPHEPAFSVFPDNFGLHVGALRDLIRRAAGETEPDRLQELASETPERARMLHASMTRANRAPEGVLGEADLAWLLTETSAASEHLAGFLAQRAEGGARYCPRLLLGGGARGEEAAARFPATRVILASGEEIEVRGEFEHLWLEGDALHLLGITWKSSIAASRKIDGTPVAVPDRKLLEPFLFAVSLQASQDAAVRRWVERRPVTVHLATAKGVPCWRLPTLSHTEARSYLTTLVEEALDPSRFELLPFDLAVQGKTFELLLDRLGGREADEVLFRALLEEAVAAGPDDASGWSIPERVALIDDLASYLPEQPLRVLEQRLGPLLRGLAAGEGGETA
jgi:exodeoxyribonuclease V gamma subunit